MLARLYRRLRDAALAATAASMFLTPLALADGDWCEAEPALVVDGHYVSITLVPHVPKTDAGQILSAETILRAPSDSHAQIAPTTGQPDFPDRAYLAPGAASHGGPMHIDATSLVSASRTPVAVDVHVVVSDQSSGASHAWTVTGQTNQAIHYVIDVP